MLWVQEIPSYRFLTPNSEKIENRQDRRITPFQVYKIKAKKEGKQFGRPREVVKWGGKTCSIHLLQPE